MDFEERARRTDLGRIIEVENEDGHVDDKRARRQSQWHLPTTTSKKETSSIGGHLLSMGSPLRHQNRASFKQKKPLRPMQAPPQVIDLTKDTPFENKWETIVPWDQRKPVAKRDPEERLKYTYDRRPVDRGLFRLFEDQGEKLREFETPNDAAQDAKFWQEERQQMFDA